MDYKKYINSAAKKVSRREMKYFIGVEDYCYFRSVFPKILNEDEYNKGDKYMVRSVYFDSIENVDFHDKIDGEEVRKKIRIRIYNPHDRVAKLEVKYKFNLNQRKESLTILKEDAIDLIEGRYESLLKYDDVMAKRVYGIMVSMLYKPKVVVEYKREAFYHSEYGIRATLDTEISSSETDFNIFSDDLAIVPVFDFTRPVLEIKYDKYLYKWFQDILSSRSCTSSSISKYCNSRQLYQDFLD
ncbi:MAG: polyphosphate polymerase domain-containing protein [Clostridium sp.]